MKSSTRAGLAALAGVAVITSGCSSKAESNQSSDEGGVEVGAGISDGTINLGMMVDLSGPFAPIGRELSQAAELYWDQKNEDGGVCGQFPVQLDLKDNAYNVQTTVSLYSGMRDNVLAFQNILGTAPSLALADSLSADDMLVVLHGQGQEALGYENIMLANATFDIEAANGLGYLLEQGAITSGGTIGHIYLEGSYGEGVLEGVEKFADVNDMTVRGIQITPAVTDMTPAIADLSSAEIDVLVVSGSPPQLASAAGAAAAAGLDVPILGSGPTWTSGLLDTSAGDVLRDKLYVAFPSASFDNPTASDFRDAYIAEYPGEDPSLQIMLEYVEARALDAVLEQACENGDLTRAGVMAAKSEVTSVETEGTAPVLDLSDPAKPATGEEYIMRAADVPGGLEVVEGPYISEVGQEILDAK
ncbi:ABC transporter substrate-binding protein [Blastococcus tunisiensis]|uniref:ABC-type branched-chain amino acid transport system, substrate-binding protein n=1 Tax=Blastococcus tunisiensis TaxID=1798228 RepID=A0A1I2JNN0_9ACTN|nr:ABC transporter substrate-binding protein [Blastococcus sp. DSM 46838]SFF54747.1 ABC-type branched-chain amino acid transport system, substrate-binding protein [Blastococcus sp. DSM 46838]